MVHVLHPASAVQTESKPEPR
jgi:hypothetical protein